MSTDNAQFSRHPLAFLVEAADDICYTIIDFEDGMNVVNDEFDEYWWETLTGNDEVVVKDTIKWVKTINKH